MTIDMALEVEQAQLHPWNTGHELPDIPGPPRRLTDDQVRRYRDDGYLLVEDVFDPADLDALRAAIDPHERRVNDLLRSVPGGRISVAAADALTVTPHLASVDQTCRDVAYGPELADLVHDLVGPDARLYWDQAVYKIAGTTDVVPWHQDNGYAYVDPQEYLTCWVPLGDATRDNGAVWVVAGAHRRGTLVHWETELGQRCLPEAVGGAELVEAPAGSVVAFSSLMPHRTGPNTTGEVRSAYILQYAPEGARILSGDPAAPPTGETPCTDPVRQLPLLVGGRHTPPPPLG